MSTCNHVFKNLRWAVIEQITGGDRFETICKDQQEAEEKARYFWDHLTDFEKRKRKMVVALVEIDDDGCCGDWVQVAQEYDGKHLL